jgi:hypothetical protein
MTRASTRSRTSRPRSVFITFPEALEKMRIGRLLRLTYVRSEPVWEIGNRSITPETAALILAHEGVKSCGDGLFDGLPCQSWRRRP